MNNIKDDGMENLSQKFDVVISGFGPVGALLGLFLAKQGHRIAIVERWQERYSLPRAVCIDHEMLRMLKTLGLNEKLAQIIHAGGSYDWVNADWKTLVAIDWGAATISLESNVNFVHQPSLERILEEEIRQYTNIRLFLGYEVEQVQDYGSYSKLQAKQIEKDKKVELTAQYIIGADGANSLVRQVIQSQWIDKGFQADWLVVDVLPHHPENLKIKGTAAVQFCNPARPTTIVPAGKNGDTYFRRWEFMRLPHETVEEMEQEERVWALLSDWVKPEDASLIRYKMYTFRSLIADQWHKGRILIAGDACHVMPPFMGQGMCAGFRDAWNLSWKLDGILKGIFDQKILQTYTMERKPHVSDIIDISMYLGKVICVPNETEAAIRDKKFFTGTAEPMPDFPNLRDGILAHQAQFQKFAGSLAPNAILTRKGKVESLDQIVGRNFVLVTTQPIEIDEQAEQIQKMGFIHLIINADEDEHFTNSYTEINANLLSFMQKNNLAAVLIRPDFYIYGTAHTTNEIDQLLNTFFNDLERYTHKIETIV